MSTNRIANLDLIRAFALILVIYYHVTQMLLGDLFTNRTWFYLGHQGVTIFFVLSGFLIAGIYYKKENIAPSKFWLSRFLRTYPPYLIMLIVSWLSVYLTRKEAFDFGFLLMAQNFYKEIPYFLVSWSLAVEEHFYLLFALLITTIKNRKVQFYFWIFLAILPTFCRVIFYRETGEFGFYKTASFLHIDSLAIGVVLAYLVHVKRIVINVKLILWIASLVIMVVLFYLVSKYENVYTWSIGRLLVNLTIGFWLICSYYSNTFRISQFKFISQTAFMAYSLYLVHPLIIHFSMLVFKKLAITSILLQYICTLTLIYVVAYIFYLLVEKRSITVRDQLLNKKSTN